MLKDAGALTSKEVTFDNISRIDVKRPQQCFTNDSEAELVPRKKQALEDPRSSFFAGVPSLSLPWGISGFNSVPIQLDENLLNTVTTRNIDSNERNILPNDTGHLISGRDPFENTSSFGLSMSHPLPDSMFGIDYGGSRKVKVIKVRDPENFMPKSIGPSHSGEVGIEATTHGYSKMDNSSVSMFPAFSREDANVMKLGELYGREYDNFLSTRQSFSKGNGTETAVRHKHEAGINIKPMSMLFGKNNFNIMSMPENFSKGDCSVIPFENQSNEVDTMISMRPVYNGDGCVSASNVCNYKVKVGAVSTAQSVCNCESHGLSVGHSLDMGETNIISFSGHQKDDDTSARMIGSYNSQTGQTAGQRLDTSSPKDLNVTNSNPAICTSEALSAGAESSSKRKDESKSLKKIPLNIFPANVRSLLSTRILDEIPVKYTAWSQEVLPGIIQGCGYLCGCQSCNFSKVINAYEFERHAGCKTKHPNNHIYFENGKTIYGVVQELRGTPQNILFDAIQTVTGSPINQKAFRLWKESFLVATRELQRIYSKDERKQLL
ncbi:hypothetical protein RND81_14G004000 [Saponaria officinalis]|uniref:Tify domain-containing protein n=1 Tax=Saponaria officinalis TaxID=3572 RepID=A0AAW1GJU5_SAPOF